MYNLERIITAIKDIESFFKTLDSMKIGTIQDLEEDIKYHASSMLCLAIINRTIDIASEILVKEAISMPAKYKEIFSSLSKEGILSKEIGQVMERLVEHRNFLAHEYEGLNKKMLIGIIRDVREVKLFVERIKKFIEKRQKNEQEAN